MGEGTGRNVRYTVGELANLSGVSARTLRHYEELGLLAPARTRSGYRVYTPRDARRLAAILAMRSCDLPLATIRHLLGDSGPELRDTLLEHLLALRARQAELEGAIAHTEAALAAVERIGNMDERDAFKALKRQAIEENERVYGREARERYGDDAVDAANERLSSLSRDEWGEKDQLEQAIKEQLRAAMATGDPTGDPAGEPARELARMHARWIALHWGEGRYSREAHRGLAQMYLADDRFRAYYDTAAGEGATEFLVAALESYLE